MSNVINAEAPEADFRVQQGDLRELTAVIPGEGTLTGEIRLEVFDLANSNTKVIDLLCPIIDAPGREVEIIITPSHTNPMNAASSSFYYQFRDVTIPLTHARGKFILRRSY